MTEGEHIEIVAGAEDAGERLDAALARRTGVSRSAIARAIDAGDVLVDGAAAARSLRLEAGMRIEARLHASAPPAPAAEAGIAAPVVYEDEHLLVVAKPAGLVVHPGAGHETGTLVHALLARPEGSRPAGGPDPLRPGIVHRLDAGTSGLLVVAKDEAAHARLTEMLAAREVARTYLALVEGQPESDEATIDAPIGRSPAHRKKMAVVAGGKPAVTHYEVVERLREVALVQVRLETGRTHQIRVHLSAAGTPVAGDPVYGRSRALARRLGLSRPFLHAARLAFDHPMTGRPLAFEDPLPKDLVAALEAARA